LEKYATDPKFSITPFYIDSCRELKIMGYQPVESYQWHDIGKIESLRAAEEAMRE
jgi:NDP-sugar pyrophosphorylase family protein